MKINKSDEGYTLIKDGKQFELTWEEFWQISRIAERNDAVSEIEDFIRDIGIQRIIH